MELNKEILKGHIDTMILAILEKKKMILMDLKLLKMFWNKQPLN